MAIRNAHPLTFRAQGLSDAVDASNAFPGAMAFLTNLVPSPATPKQFVPRPASTQVTNFAGFSTPNNVEALFVVGTRAYGMIQSARNAGKSEPFCYDLANGAFVTIAGVTSANSPTSTSNSGSWVPPTLTMIGNRIIVTHPGYDGSTHFIGWIDMRSFTLATTGSTHTSTTLDGLVSTAGVAVGDKVSAADIPANTFVVTINSPTSVTLSQAATGSNAGEAVTFTSGTFAAPQYGSGQTSGQPLAAVPTACEQFNGRAYYAVNNTLQFSDALVPTQITNASQALTCGDSQAITALGGLPLTSQVVGGVIQSLIAFKGDDVYYQVTGDPATTNLTLNAVAGSVGTLAGNTVVPTPLGLAYVAPDGLRFIGLDGKCSEPVGANGAGVNLPFYYAVNPSRMCAAYNQNVLRISVQNGYVNGQPWQEYWFDCNLKTWTGPHTFPAALIAGYHQATNTFVMAAQGIAAKLWQSDTVPLSASTYTENGATMSLIWQPCLLPDNEAVEANQVVESAIGLNLPNTQALAFLAVNEAGATLGVVDISGPNALGSVWNGFNWGAAPWGGAVSSYQQYSLDWPAPLVFKQMTIRVTGQSSAGLAIGNLYAKYQVLGYQGAPG